MVLSLRRLSALGLDRISLRSLKAIGVVKTERQRVKIVSDGDIDKAITVIGVPASLKAKEKIVKAGGKVV